MKQLGACHKEVSEKLACICGELISVYNDGTLLIITSDRFKIASILSSSKRWT